MNKVSKSFVCLKQTKSIIIRSLATQFSGINLSLKIKMHVKRSCEELIDKHPHFKPKLVAISVGDNSASKIYLKRKLEAAQFCGIDFDNLSLPSNTKEDYLTDLVQNLNSQHSVHGVIVQLPLPPHMDEVRVCNSVDPLKDVDGFTQTNLGRLMQGLDTRSLIPCTALAVMRIIKEIGISTLGKNAVVIGRSHNVGLPVHILLAADWSKGGLDMSSSLCHRHTPPHQLARAVSGADVLVSAAGVPGLVTREMVRPGAVVIDVGLSRKKGRLVGDVDAGVTEVASVVTPVPGGVGPCTVACLMHNTLLAADLQIDR